MAEFFIVLMLIIGTVVMGRVQKKRALVLVDATATARLRHLRAAEFPSSCSWCKNTALARKLLVFERTDDIWRATDLVARLAAVADAEVERLASVLSSDQPRWRRICTERCAREFFAAEQVAMVEAFTSCAYCSSRSPASLARCPNCGAARTG